jgi:hypothetical protein
MATPTTSSSDLEQLKAMVGGDVFGPDGAGFDDARRAWDLAADQRPAAVVFAESVVEVVRALRFVCAHGMQVAPQGTCHGELGPEIDAFAMLRPPALSQLHMDPEQPVPGVGDGAFLADLTADAIDTVIERLRTRHPKLVRSQVRALKDALTPWNPGYDYYNFVETPAEADVVLPPASISAYRRSRRCTTPTGRSSRPTRWPAGGCYDHDRRRGAEVTSPSVWRATTARVRIGDEVRGESREPHPLKPSALPGH